MCKRAWQCLASAINLRAAYNSRTVAARWVSIPSLVSRLPPSSSTRSLFPAFPDLLRNGAEPVLGALPNSPPICVVRRLHCLFKNSVPPVLCHLRQPNRDFTRPGLLLWLLGLVEACENVALLAQKRGLCCAVLCVQGDGEIEDGRGEREAPKLLQSQTECADKGDSMLTKPVVMPIVALRKEVLRWRKVPAVPNGSNHTRASFPRKSRRISRELLPR